MSKAMRSFWLPLGLTLIVVGYFLPWLSHPAQGLTLIGLDISEWVKFLPQMQSGELPNRDLFYVPPISLGLILVLLSVEVRGYWRPWLLRGLGMAVALIAFPSIDAIRFEPSGEWRPRLVMIGVVVVVAFVTVWGGRWPSWLMPILIVLVASVGLFLPTYLFVILLPVLESWLVIDFRMGGGIWLNGFGHLIVGVGVLWVWRDIGFRGTGSEFS